MPHKVEKRSGKKPYKVVNRNTGKVKASSATKKGAAANARIRDKAHRKKK